MKDTIYRDDAIKCCRNEWEEEVEERLRLLPSADVVEVVRCKECKWFNKIGCAIYIFDDSDKPTGNDYCSFGERRN